VGADTPLQVKQMQEFGMQYIFHANGWFLLYTLKELLADGRLKLPTRDCLAWLCLTMQIHSLQGLCFVRRQWV
jgi:hypothetical protein